jgi:hypothetical protein
MLSAWEISVPMRGPIEVGTVASSVRKKEYNKFMTLGAMID